MTELSKKLYNFLTSFDTPTICNAIEIAQGKRGFDNFSKSTVKVADPKARPLLGFALTAKIKARVKPTLPKAKIKKIRKEYYEYMAGGSISGASKGTTPGTGPTGTRPAGTRPSICVIEDTDYPKEVGAFWGELNTWIHKGFKISGTITNGVMRDLDNLAPGYQVLANSIGPSHAFVHVTAIDVPVSVFGVKIKPNDLIHADRHGLVNIPLDLIGNLEKSVKTLLKNEKIILDAAQKKDFNYEKFAEAWDEFERVRT